MMFGRPNSDLYVVYTRSNYMLYCYSSVTGNYTDVLKRNFHDAHDIFFCDTERRSLSVPVTTASVRNRTLEPGWVIGVQTTSVVAEVPAHQTCHSSTRTWCV